MVSSCISKPTCRGHTSIVVLCGPTGSGKGALAQSVARSFTGEIISADSRKIFRYMDLGTAKPSHRVRAQIPHHLIDICKPGESFNARRFIDLADKAILQITSRGHLPIVVGGTWLYIRALLYGIVSTPPSNPRLRAQLQTEEKERPGCLYQKLARVDPITATRLTPRDLVRIIRALEVCDASPRTLSDIQQEHGFRTKRYRAWIAAPKWTQNKLKQRINQRVTAMLEAGWLDEVKMLRSKNANTALNVVGYRELDCYLQGKCTLECAVSNIQRAHWQYARSQLTWLRSISNLHWLSTPVDTEALTEKIKEFLGT